ncbi:hypothetical protein GCM10023094_11160 [Rhodococcus olei]|uniref:Uncharacterized protein n=1 Tax=Rhodococcus olei TaxID=2161675 RepID=A0ABP8NYL7_9NOCA
MTSRRRTGPRILRVSKAGSVSYRKRKIGVGQAYTGQQVTVTQFGETVIVTHTGTGKPLRELTLGAVGTYHRNGNKRGRPRKDRTVDPVRVVSAVSWQHSVRDVPGPLHVRSWLGGVDFDRRFWPGLDHRQQDHGWFRVVGVRERGVLSGGLSPSRERWSCSDRNEGPRPVRT